MLVSVQIVRCTIFTKRAQFPAFGQAGTARRGCGAARRSLVRTEYFLSILLQGTTLGVPPYGPLEGLRASLYDLTGGPLPPVPPYPSGPPRTPYGPPFAPLRSGTTRASSGRPLRGSDSPPPSAEGDPDFPPSCTSSGTVNIHKTPQGGTPGGRTRRRTYR